MHLGVLLLPPVQFLAWVWCPGGRCCWRLRDSEAAEEGLGPGAGAGRNLRRLGVAGEVDPRSMGAEEAVARHLGEAAGRHLLTLLR